MQPVLNNRTCHPRAWSAVACLVALLLALPGVVPGMLGLLAALDGSHQVILSEGATAGGELILHHAADRIAPRPAHHHCRMARFLVLLAEPGNQNPDHVLKFNACHALVQASPEKIKRTEAMAQPVDRHVACRVSPPLRFAAAVTPPAPPLGSTPVERLRSTILLI